MEVRPCVLTKDVINGSFDITRTIELITSFGEDCVLIASYVWSDACLVTRYENSLPVKSYAVITLVRSICTQSQRLAVRARLAELEDI